MHRRNFIKVSAAAGLSVLAPWSRHALAAEELVGFDGPFWITINLAGAWDSTLFCDPKGDLTDGSGNGPINHYTQGDIVELNVGGQVVRLAPGTHDVTGSYYHHVPGAGGAPVHVLEHLASRGVTLINGVDAGLTNHKSGEQLAMSGSTAADFPTLAALVAYNALVDRDPAPNGPMPLLSFGGYDGTANLVPATRLNRLEVLGQITQPDTIGQHSRTGKSIHGTARKDLIAEACRARSDDPSGRSSMPSKARAMSQLFVARSREHHVGRLLQRFDFPTFESLPGRLEKQAYVALRAFEGGLAAGANLVLGGWDSHNKNDRIQALRMRDLFRALMFIKDEAEALGIAHRVNVVAGSDFGRTTYYKSLNNPDSGKDHHSVTSWLTMLWGSGVENGVRVLGETDDQVVARGLDANLLPVAPDQGVVLTPGIIHQDLRRLAGLGEGTIADRFPLIGPHLPLWG
jgi:hypothetical protein